MSTPDRQQILDAWETIDCMSAAHTSRGAYYSDLAAIKAVLPERPAQTMDELGWDQDQHYLAEAETFDGDGDKVIILYGRKSTSETVAEIVTNAGIFAPENLTPTGRRYKLVLDDDHPEWLETEQDYEDAPEGTVIAADGKGPWKKNINSWKIGRDSHRNYSMAGTRRRVLRWGKGNDA